MNAFSLPVFRGQGEVLDSLRAAKGTHTGVGPYIRNHTDEIHFAVQTIDAIPHHTLGGYGAEVEVIAFEASFPIIPPLIMIVYDSRTQAFCRHHQSVVNRLRK